MALILAAFFCLASGFLIVRMGSGRLSASGYLFTMSLSAGFGLGVFSVVFYLGLLLGTSHFILLDLAILLLLLVGYFWFRTRVATNEPVVERAMNQASPAWLRHFLTAGFVIALGAALYAAIMRTLAYPHGDGWDAFSIWNLHARFLFRGGVNWRDGFTTLLPWSHPDYPLLLPAAVAHFWKYLGRDCAVIPGLIGIVFTFSTVGLLFAALSILRGRLAALLGTTALLATPSFIEQGTSQYADVPLSFFVLASVALLCIFDEQSRDSSRAIHAQGPNGLIVLAGLACAFAAWTKNEGLLFLCAFVLARSICLLSPLVSDPSWFARLRPVVPLLAVLAPALLLIASFKHFIAPPGDLFSDSSATFHKLLIPARYWAVTKWYFKEFFRFGRWLLIPGTVGLIGIYFGVGREFRRARDESSDSWIGIRTSALALALTLAGYFAVYLITPYDIYWHLRFSLSRLFLQLWPSAIFLFFLTVKWDGSQPLRLLRNLR
jgi:hypothetical protein